MSITPQQQTIPLSIHQHDDTIHHIRLPLPPPAVTPSSPQNPQQHSIFANNTRPNSPHLSPSPIPSEPPLQYNPHPLQIDASKFDRVEIGDAVYPPILSRSNNTGNTKDTKKRSFLSSLFSSKLNIFLWLAILILLFRASVGMLSNTTNDSISSLNSSIQLGLYACIWYLCYYISNLHSPLFTQLYNNYLSDAKSHLISSQSNQTNTDSTPPNRLSQLSTQFVINTDRKLTLYVFFIFNLLLFTLLVGLIEDFHGSHSSRDPLNPFPIKSIYDQRHPLHTAIPGHLDPQTTSHIVHPHKALHTFLQLFPFQRSMLKAHGSAQHRSDTTVATGSSIYLPIVDPKRVIESAFKKSLGGEDDQHDQHDHPGEHNSHNHDNHHNDPQKNNQISNTNSGTTTTTTTTSPNNDSTSSSQSDYKPHNDLENIYNHQMMSPEEKRIQQMKEAEQLQLVLESIKNTSSSSSSITITTILASFILHIIVLVLTYPYSSHLITTVPILTFYSSKKPTSLIEKWYGGLHGLSKLAHNQSTTNLSTITTIGLRNAPKWSYKWFYHHIYPYHLSPHPSLSQSIIYRTINLLDTIGIGINPTSLYDITIVSMCWYIALFIVMKDLGVLLSFFESHYLFPFYTYYLTRAPSITSAPPSFTQAIQLGSILFMVMFTLLWLIKLGFFLFTLYWSVVVTWSLILTLLRSGVTNTGNYGGVGQSNVYSNIDDVNMKHIGSVLRGLQRIYFQQYQLLEQQHAQEQNQGGDDKNEFNVQKMRYEYQIKKLQKQMSVLLFERLHVWKLSHNISIVTLCLYYNDIIKSVGYGKDKSDNTSSTTTTTTTAADTLDTLEHLPNNLKKQSTMVPQWCIDIIRSLIHDNQSIGSGYNNTNINNGKLNFAMLLQLPSDHQ